MGKTGIEWTDETWNPVTGCDKVSKGCKFCYAEVMALRIQAMGQPRYRNGFKVTLQPDKLTEPLIWTKPRMIFVNSMSDLFHKDIPDDYIMQVFDTMNKAKQHTFQVLTKRSKRLAQLAPKLNWTKNIWIGVSVEDSLVTHRIDDLRTVTQAKVRFLSIEPLLNAIPNMNLTNIDWVIVGGESGNSHDRVRPMRTAWVEDIRDQCILAQVPFFFKQWGGVNKKKNGRILQGKTYDEFPKV